MEWGSVPEWVGAIGTTGAFVAGLVLLGKELQEHRSRRAERRLEAASQVSTWWEYDRSRSGDPAPSIGKGVKSFYTAFWALHVRNGGPAPVYDCTVYVGPRKDFQQLPDSYFFPVVAGGTTLSENLDDMEIELWHDEDKGLLAKDVWAEVTFTDPSGRSWLRDAYGRLVELPSLLDPEMLYTDSTKPDKRRAL